MDAILLAAGVGTRLRPHTLTTPKPLLPVQNRPLLDWTIAALPSCVDRLLVVTHYLADQIEAYLAHQKHVLDWVAIPQGTPRGTGDALRKCQSFVQSDRFLVINGDDLFGAADLAAFRAHTPAGVICQEVVNPRQWGIAFVNADGTVEKLVEKPDIQGPQLANTGAYLFPKSVFELEIGLSPRGEYEITDFVSQLAAAPFHVVKATFWYPIGTEEAWQKAQTLDLASVLTRAE